MLVALVSALAVLALCVGLLAVKSLCGRGRFELHDVDDVAALRQRGISCPRKQDADARRQPAFRIGEHGKKE